MNFFLDKYMAVRHFSNTRNYYLSDTANVNSIRNLNNFFEDLDLDACIIGGQAVSATMFYSISSKIKKMGRDYYLNENIDYIKKNLRSTADIDIVVKGTVPEGFYENLRNYFGYDYDIIQAGDQIDIISTLETQPYWSFYFIDENSPRESGFYNQFIDSSVELKLDVNANNYLSCRYADSLDLFLMKLVSCTGRINAEKTDHDLYDMYLLQASDVERINIDSILRRAGEIGYLVAHDRKIKKGLKKYVSYLDNEKGMKLLFGSVQNL